MPRHLIRAAQVLAAVLLTACPAASQTAASDAAALDDCNLSAWSTDDDPAGLNIRAGPGTDYPVIGRLLPPRPSDGDGYAPEVNIVESQDGWFRIDRATTNNYGDADPEVVFEGEGWVSGRFLGRSMEGAYLYGSPSSDMPAIFDFNDRPGAAKDPDHFRLERLVACRGWWVEVEGTYFGEPLRGWTDDTCGNQVTTCP